MKLSLLACSITKLPEEREEKRKEKPFSSVFHCASILPAAQQSSIGSGSNGGAPFVFSLLYSRSTSNEKITEKEERGKTKQDKIKKKIKILSFSSPPLCSFFLLSVSPFSSFIQSYAFCSPAFPLISR